MKLTAAKIRKRIDTINSQQSKMRDNQLWYLIRQEAQNNEALQNALEQCILIYNLGKGHKNGI